MGRLKAEWSESFTQKSAWSRQKENNHNYSKSMRSILLCRQKKGIIWFLWNWNSVGRVLLCLKHKISSWQRHNESYTHDQFGAPFSASIISAFIQRNSSVYWGFFTFLCRDWRRSRINCIWRTCVRLLPLARRVLVRVWKTSIPVVQCVAWHRIQRKYGQKNKEVAKTMDPWSWSTCGGCRNVKSQWLHNNCTMSVPFPAGPPLILITENFFLALHPIQNLSLLASPSWCSKNSGLCTSAGPISPWDLFTRVYDPW